MGWLIYTSLCVHVCGIHLQTCVKNNFVEDCTTGKLTVCTGCCQRFKIPCVQKRRMLLLRKEKNAKIYTPVNSVSELNKHVTELSEYDNVKIIWDRGIGTHGKLLNIALLLMATTHFRKMTFYILLAPNKSPFSYSQSSRLPEIAPRIRDSQITFRLSNAGWQP